MTLVEDRPTAALLEGPQLIRESLALLLLEAGIPVVHQSGTVDAFLAGVVERAPSVAVVDAQAEPGPTPLAGYQVIQALRTQRPEMGVVSFSAEASAEAMEATYRAGATAFVSKDSSAAVLIAAVRAAARGERWVPADFASLDPTPAPRPQAPSLLEALTPREREVLTYITGGADNLKIAACLDICERTVKTHVTSLYRKLGAENRTQMALLARQLGLLPVTHA